MSPPSPTMSESESKAEIRKSNKPLMEKRRRARINASLTQLKGLVLEAMKKDTSRYSKLEKADILDMTVKHLKAVHRQQMTAAMTNDPSIVGKYKAGFSECAKEVTRYLNTVSGVEPEVRTRLFGHLGNCLQQQSAQQQITHQSLQPLRIQIPPVTTAMTQIQQMEGIQTSTPVVSVAPNYVVPAQDYSNMGTVQLIPGTLPSGEVAYFVPSQGQMNTMQGHFSNARHGVAPASFTPAQYPRQAHSRTPSMGSEAPSTSSSPDSLCSSPLSSYSDIQGSPINLHKYQQSSVSAEMSKATFRPIPEVAVIKQEEPVWRPW